MALTPQEKTLLDQLKQSGASKQEMSQALAKTREGSPVSEFFTGIGKGLYGIARQASRLAPGDQSADPTSFYSKSKGWMEQADIERMKSGQSPESFASKAGEFTGEMLPTLPVSFGTSALANLGLKGVAKVAPSVASRVSPFLSLGSKPTLGNLAKFGAVEGAKDTAIYDLATEGETTLGRIATGAVGGAVLSPALGLIGKGFSKAKTLPGEIPTGKITKTLRQETPVRLVENNLNFTPTQVEKFQSQFKVSPGEYLLQNKLAGKSKEELFDLFNDKFTNAYTKKSEMLAPYTQRFRNEEIDEMIDIIERNVRESSGDMAQADLQSYLNAINNIKGIKQYTLKDTVDILREFDNWLKIYDAKGFVKGTGANKSLAKLRDRVSDFLEREAKKIGVDVGTMNKDIRISKQFQDGLFRSIIKDNKNNLLGLNDLLLGNLLSGGDPFTGLAVTLAKKGITGKMNTAMPKFAQSIYKYYENPISVSSGVRSSRGVANKSRFAPSVYPLRGTPVEALPAPSGKPLSPKKVSGTYKETILQGKQKILPDNPIQDITPRSKIVQPGTYKEAPVQKIAKKQETPNSKRALPMSQKSDVVYSKPISKTKKAKELEGKVFYTGQKSEWTPKKLREYNPSTDDSLMYGPGLYLTPDMSIAKGYAQGGGKVHTVLPDIKNPLTPGMKDWLTFIQKGNGKMKQDFLIKNGYDAVVDIKGKYKQIMIVDPESVKVVNKSALPMSSRTPVKYGKVDDLASEARKYKTADEFIKAQGEPVYHGGNVARETFDISKAGSKEQGHNAKAGFWFAKDINTAKGYGKNVTEIYPKASLKNPKIIDADGEMFGDMRDIIDDAIKQARKDGNDGVIIKNLSDEKDWGNYNPTDHYVIFNPENIITKKKLIDLFNNKANK